MLNAERDQACRFLLRELFSVAGARTSRRLRPEPGPVRPACAPAQGGTHSWWGLSRGVGFAHAVSEASGEATLSKHGGTIAPAATNVFWGDAGQVVQEISRRRMREGGTLDREAEGGGVGGPPTSHAVIPNFIYFGAHPSLLCPENGRDRWSQLRPLCANGRRWRRSLWKWPVEAR
jgi:hypothetical protein